MSEARSVWVGTSGKQKHEICRETRQSSGVLFTAVEFGWNVEQLRHSGFYHVLSRMPCGTSYKCWGYNKAQSPWERSGETHVQIRA